MCCATSEVDSHLHVPDLVPNLVPNLVPDLVPDQPTRPRARGPVRQKSDTRVRSVPDRDRPGLPLLRAPTHSHRGG